jgi:predicted esterase
MNFALQFVLNAPARSSTMPFEWKTVTLTSGSTLRYGLVLPENFDPDKTYPVLLAFPPGPQDESMVEAGMGYWAGEASRRDWIIVSPAAPNGRLFFRGSELLIPEFLDHIAEAYHVENDVFHVGGISNGGISAFRTAIDYPERFRSILVLPGYPPAPDDFDNLDRLSDMQVAMFVGAGDSSGWIDNSQRTEESLKALGIPVQLEIVAGEGHVIQSLAADAGRLFDLLDSFR